MKTIEWIGDSSGHLRLLDQTGLPLKASFIDCKTTKELFDAIRRLSVRGAPAIGVSAAYGVLLGLRDLSGEDRSQFDATFFEVADYLAESRPTAVNLFGHWSV